MAFGKCEHGILCKKGTLEAVHLAVTPSALADAVSALISCNIFNIVVTKIDGELHLVYNNTERYKKRDLKPDNGGEDTKDDYCNGEYCGPYKCK